jgi:gluconate:H+ symporter, GntP family
LIVKEVFMLLILLLVASVAFLILATSRLHLHPFLALLFTAIGYGLFSGMPLNLIASSINEGFGATIGHVGILIVAGTIIGTFLDQSGGAFSLAERIVKTIGERHVPAAMAFIGWVVSIPVFGDSGFVILAPLNRALTKRAKLSLATTVVALAMGLTASHNLVPPTPGPIAAAGILNADLGLVIMLGAPIGLFAAMIGWLWATRVASRVYIDPKPEMTEQEMIEKVRQAPSAGKAVVPIVVPILLILMRSVAAFPTRPLGEGFLWSLFMFIGDPIIALIIGVLLAFLLPKKFETQMLSASGWVGKGMLNAAIIILITGAGGAFGRVLQNSGMAAVVGETLSEARLGIWLPFLLAAAIKSAQGSSTVALITTASLFAPLATALGFDTPLAVAFAVLAIGAGSMVASHANDSMFWVVTQMSNMDVPTGYKLHSLGTAVMGTSAAALIWLLSLFLF